MEIYLRPLQHVYLAIGYVLVVLTAQSIFQEYVLPRFNFSKTSINDLRQMLLRWVLLSKRFDFSLKRDILALLMTSVLLTAIAILPLDGQSGLRVDRPDLAIAELMSIFYFLRVFWSWQSRDGSNWEKALEEVLFASSRVFVFLLLVDGAYLAARPGQFRALLGEDWLIASSPFHFAGFVLGILLVGFFQGRQEHRKHLRGLSLFSWKVEPILWITLLLVTFLNTATIPGISYFLILAAKCIAIIFFLDLVRSHISKIRMDQLERIGLTLVYPIVILIFLGMWWREVLR